MQCFSHCLTFLFIGNLFEKHLYRFVLCNPFAYTCKETKKWNIKKQSKLSIASHLETNFSKAVFNLKVVDHILQVPPPHSCLDWPSSHGHQILVLQVGCWCFITWWSCFTFALITSLEGGRLLFNISGRFLRSWRSPG